MGSLPRSPLRGNVVRGSVARVSNLLEPRFWITSDLPTTRLESPESRASQLEKKKALCVTTAARRPVVRRFLHPQTSRNDPGYGVQPPVFAQPSSKKTMPKSPSAVALEMTWVSPSFVMLIRYVVVAVLPGKLGVFVPLFT